MDSLQVMFGRRMRARRALLGMSQDELAGETRIPQEHISRYERGAFQSINLIRLVDIAKALQTTPNELLGVVDEEGCAALAGASQATD